MALQRFSNMAFDTDEVIDAVAHHYAFEKRIVIYNRTCIFRLFIWSYHDYHTGFAREKFAWIKEDYREYLRETHLPFYIMKIGSELIRQAHEQAFIEKLKRRDYEGLEDKADPQTKGRVLRRKVSEHRGGDGLSIATLSSGK
jgi:hypothetical protein